MFLDIDDVVVDVRPRIGLFGARAGRGVSRETPSDRADPPPNAELSDWDEPLGRVEAGSMSAGGPMEGRRRAKAEVAGSTPAQCIPGCVPGSW